MVKFTSISSIIMLLGSFISQKNKIHFIFIRFFNISNRVTFNLQPAF